MNFLYQAYGLTDVCEQVLFSILSLQRFLNPADHVIIYTDRPSFFETYFSDVLTPEQLILRDLSAGRIAEWQGPTQFVHRLKICMIRDALSKLSAAAELLLYLDGDTVWLEDPRLLARELMAGKLIMHENEGRLNEGPNVLTKKIHRFLKKTRLSFELAEATTMHNAGVLGLRGSDSALADQALAVSDELYQKYPKHVMEQLAFSLTFEMARPVYPALKEIHHYWRTKVESFAKVHQFLLANPLGSRALASPNLEKLFLFFHGENKNLSLTGGKITRPKQSWWRWWWQRRS